MLIGGFQKSSLLDFRNNIAAIVFTLGCNFSCPYCHNPELVRVSGFDDVNFPIAPTVNEILDFLKTRKAKLDGVVITGGEPTLHHDLPQFIQKIKELNFLTKLDTNGTNPSMLQGLLDDKLVDYVAMDIKAPFDEYENVTRRAIEVDKIRKSVDIIIKNAPDYEFRTTVTNRLLNFNSFVKINDEFKKYCKNGKIKRYYLQKFQKSKHLDNSYLDAEVFDDETFEKIRQIFVETVAECQVR